MLTTSSKDIVLASQAESDKKYSGKKVKKKKICGRMKMNLLRRRDVASKMLPGSSEKVRQDGKLGSVKGQNRPLYLGTVSSG